MISVQQPFERDHSLRWPPRKSLVQGEDAYADALEHVMLMPALQL